GSRTPRPVPCRFVSSLYEPDRRISRFRLSDKTSRLHPRHVVPKPAQAYEPEVPVEVREWISPALASPDLVLDAPSAARPAARTAWACFRARPAIAACRLRCT